MFLILLFICIDFIITPYTRTRVLKSTQKNSNNTCTKWLILF
ncbi:hypothetical protein HMPREF0971_00001 [Segatella oris F0302]|uniref:Uncharacterized protein n=1 Tax=Segatella oris F0302 TaxID=649760 RepID=D1QM27_9BACT|nr:hypothetical protein HMPREF0971_02569 [Segatella oris F0302]EFB33619.1 hypothetical protein HMPREF0971_00001 [Segatella oris F0302]